MSPADLVLERRIDHLAAGLATAKTPTARRRVWAALRAAIAAHSSAAVAELERQRGLR